MRKEVGKADFLCVKPLVTLSVELELWVESKILCPSELRGLLKKFGNSQAVADKIGSSEAFVRENVQKL